MRFEAEYRGGGDRLRAGAEFCIISYVDGLLVVAGQRGHLLLAVLQDVLFEPEGRVRCLGEGSGLDAAPYVFEVVQERA